MDRWYVTLYRHSWGRGHTPEEAKKNARKAGGTGTAWLTVQLPERAQDPYVDDFGSVGWTWPGGWSDGRCILERRTNSDLVTVARGRGAKART